MAPSNSHDAFSLPDAKGHKPESVWLPSACLVAGSAGTDDGGDHGVGILAVDVVLALRGEVGEEPRVGVNDT